MKQALRGVVRSIGPVHRLVSRARGSRIHRPSRHVRGMMVIGSDYGGWAVVQEGLGPAAIVYSVGVGQDISFDLGMIERFGCAIEAFDPTPLSRAWIEAQPVPPEFHFHPIGLGAADGEEVFHAPAIEGHVSFSRTGTPEGDTTKTVTCPIRRLSTLMQDLGHTRIDVLKMDIEGFEYAVVEDLIAGSIRPRQLLIEFHHNMYSHSRSDTERSVAMILAAGYELFWVSNVGHEYAFVAGASVH